jgi:molecular chaperone HscB
VQLNDAWKTLRDPVKRAEYLLAQAGLEVGGEEGTRRRRADGAGTDKVPVPQALLMDVMELREGLMDARAEEDHARVTALTADVRERRRTAMDAVAAAFAASPADIDRAAAELVAVRYYDRFLAEVTAGEGVSAQLNTGSNHAG